MRSATFTPLFLASSSGSTIFCLSTTQPSRAKQSRQSRSSCVRSRHGRETAEDVRRSFGDRWEKICSMSSFGSFGTGSWKTMAPMSSSKARRVALGKLWQSSSTSSENELAEPQSRGRWRAYGDVLQQEAGVWRPSTRHEDQASLFLRRCQVGWWCHHGSPRRIAERFPWRPWSSRIEWMSV